MSSSRPAPPKRIVLINRDFQLRYTRAAVGVGVLSTVLTTVIILYPLYTFQILRIPQFLPVPILAAMLFAALLNIFFVGMMGLFITHKIAGPMYSLVRHFRRISMKQYGRFMRLREDDDMRFLVRNFNEMQACLIATTKDDLALLRECLAVFYSSGAAKATQQEALASLEGLCQDLERRVEMVQQTGAGR